MIIGIVGSEEVKFTDTGKVNAFYFLSEIIDKPEVTKVVSGGCHLGGIDKWAILNAKEYKKEFEEFLPKTLNWINGYKERNIKIAEASDIVYCITVNELPKEYTGMRFPLCYHCKTKDHVKSGGCWTMKYAEKLGKQGKLIIVNNYE